MSLTAGLLGALIGNLYTALRGDKKSRIDESRTGGYRHRGTPAYPRGVLANYK